MDVAALALKVHELNSWLQQQEEPAFAVHRLQAVPFGHAEVSIDVTATSPAASLNRNRIYLCGDGNGLSRSGLQEIVALFGGRSDS